MTSNDSDYDFDATDSHLYAKIILTALICALVFFAAIGNGLLCFVILRSKNCRHMSDIYIASLATADLLMCVIVFPFSVVYEFERTWHFGDVFCAVWLYLDSSLCAVTIYTMSVICMDVCFYVKRSFVTLHKITHKKTRILTTCIWAAGLVLGGITFIMRHASDDPVLGIGIYKENRQCIFRETIYTAVMSSALIFLLPFVWCMYVYRGVIFRVIANEAVRKSLNAAHEGAANRYNLPSTGLFTITDIQTGILTLGIKLFIFFFSWLPFFVVKVMVSVCESRCTTSLLRSVVIWLPYVSSWVNPFIYGMLNKRVHNRLKHLCACCNVKREVQSQQSSMTSTSIPSHSSVTIGNSLPNLQPVSSDIINVAKTERNVQLMHKDTSVDPKVPGDPTMRPPVTPVYENIDPVGVTHVSFVTATYDADCSAASSSIDTYLPSASDKQPLPTFEAKQRQSDIAKDQKRPRKRNILTPITFQVADTAKLQVQKNNGLSDSLSRARTKPDSSPRDSSPLELDPQNTKTLQRPKLRKKSAMKTKPHPALVHKLETSKKEHSQNLKSKQRLVVAESNSPDLVQKCKSSKEGYFPMLEATKIPDTSQQSSPSLEQKPSDSENESLSGAEANQRPDMSQQTSPALIVKLNGSNEGFLQSPNKRSRRSKEEAVQNPDDVKRPGMNSSYFEHKVTSSNEGSLEVTKGLGMFRQKSPFVIQKPIESKESQLDTKISGSTPQIHSALFQKQNKSKDVCLQSLVDTKRPGITRKTSSSRDQKFMRWNDGPGLSGRHSYLTNEESSRIPRKQGNPADKRPFKRSRSAERHRNTDRKANVLASCQLKDVQVSKLLNEESLQMNNSVKEPSLIHKQASSQPAEEFTSAVAKNVSSWSLKFTEETEVGLQDNNPQLPEDLTPRKDISLESMENPKSSPDVVLMYKEKSPDSTHEAKLAKNRSLQSRKSPRCSKTSQTNCTSFSQKPRIRVTEIPSDGLLEATGIKCFTSLADELTERAQGVCKTNTNKTGSKSTRLGKLNTTKVKIESRAKSERPPYVLQLTHENLAALERENTFNRQHSQSVMAMASSHNSINEDKWPVTENAFEPHMRNPTFSRNIRHRRSELSKSRFASCRKSTQKTEPSKTNFGASGSSPQKQPPSKIGTSNSNPQSHGPSKGVITADGNYRQRHAPSKVPSYSSNPQRDGPSNAVFFTSDSCLKKYGLSEICFAAGGSNSPTCNKHERSKSRKTIFAAGASNLNKTKPSNVVAAGGSSPLKSRPSKTIVTTSGSSPKGPFRFDADGGSKRYSPSSDSGSTGMFVEVGSQIEGTDGTSSDDMKSVGPQQSFIGSGDATGQADADDESVHFTTDAGLSVKNRMQLSGSEDDDYDTKNFWGIKTLKPRPTGQKTSSVQKENRQTEDKAWAPETQSSLSTMSTVFDSHPKGLLAAILADRQTGDSWSSSSDEASNMASSSGETFSSLTQYSSPTAAKQS